MTCEELWLGHQETTQNREVAVSPAESQAEATESQAEAAESEDKAVKKGVTDEPHEGDFFL